jgi:C-terminal processing protease CtpA/Prc
MQHAAQPATAGVGITFRQLATGGFVVVKVASGGPSDWRGVQTGDILTRVDRQEVRAPCKSCPALATQRVDYVAAPA